MRKVFCVLVALSMLFVGMPAFAAVSTSDESVLGNKRWRVTSAGDFKPADDSTYTIGASGTEVKTVYCDEIVVGGDSVTGASGITSPMEDVGTYVQPIDGGGTVKLYDNGNLAATGEITTDAVNLENGAKLDNTADGTFTITEGGTTLSMTGDGTDMTMDVDTGGLTVKLTNTSNGTFDVYCNNVSTDYLSFSQGTNQATITATGTGNDLYLVAAGGDINCADENILTTGTLGAGAATFTSIAGFTSMTLGDETLSRSADDVLRWTSNDEAATFLIMGYTSKAANLQLQADLGADAGDTWQVTTSTSDNLDISNDSSVKGTQATVFSMATSGAITMEGNRITFGNDEYLDNTTDGKVQVVSTVDTILEVYSAGTGNTDASIQLVGDAGADTCDRWKILNDSDAGTLIFQSDSGSAGTYVTKLTVAGSDGDITTTGDIEVIDDMDLVFGTNSDWKVQYDEGVDDQLLFLTANTACSAITDPMVEFIVGTTPTSNQQVFGLSKGTQASNTALFTVDAEGDTAVTGDLAITGNDLTSAGDLLITPAGTEVHINGGLDVGGTSAVGDNNLNVDGTAVVAGGALSLTGTTPLFTVGDGGNEDVTVKFDGQTTKDFYVATDNADDSLIIGVGSTVGTDSRITVQDDADNTLIELGDNGAFDLTVVFDGSTQDFYMGYDHSGYSGDFVIGKGATMGTTPAVVIDDTNANVEIINDMTVDGGDVTFTSATASKPAIAVTSSVVGSTSSITTYAHTRGGVAAVDGDDIHTDIYQSYDDAGTPATNDYVTILYEVTDQAAGAEDGNMTISVSTAGTSSNFLELDGVDGIDVNAGAVDIDFAIAGNDQADLMVVDAGNNDVTLTRNLAAGATTDSAMLTVTQSSATADNGCVSITNAAGASATDPTVVIQSSAAGVVKSSLFVNHDGTAGATTESAVRIDSEDVNAAAVYITSPVTAAGTTSQIDDYALAVVAEGVGGGASIYRNVTGASEALLHLREVHVDSSAELLTINSAADDTSDNDIMSITASAATFNDNLLKITNASVGRSLFVDHNVTSGTTLVPAMEIDSQATNGAALIVRAPTTLTGTDADFDDFVMVVSAEGVGGGLHVNRSVDDPTGPLVRICDDLAAVTTSNDNTLEVVCDGDDSVSAAVVAFTTTSAAHDQPVLSVTQAGTGAAITIVSGALAVNGDSITSDGVLTINATSATSFNDENITNVGQIDIDTLAADGTALAIGVGTETVAINSSDWDINATGDMTGIGAITSNGVGTFTGACTFTGGLNTAVVNVTDATTYAILAANSGKVHWMPDLTADDVLTLPTPAAGLNFTFVYGGAAADAHDWTFNTGADANYFIGGIVGHDTDDGDALAVMSNGTTNSKVKIDTPSGGSIVHFWCDGTHWVISGQVTSATDTHSAFSNQ